MRAGLIVLAGCGTTQPASLAPPSPPAGCLVSTLLALLLAVLAPGVLAGASAPAISAVYTGPTLSGSTYYPGQQMIAVSGLADPSGRSFSLLAYALEPEILRIVATVHAAGSATAAVEVAVAVGGNSRPRPTSRVLITVIDDADPTVTATAAVDVPVETANVTPWLGFLGTITVPPRGSVPYSREQFAANDPEGDPIWYTVWNLPTRGELRLYRPDSGAFEVVGLGGSFSQQDIDQRHVSYRNTVVAPGATDRWDFTLASEPHAPAPPLSPQGNYFGFVVLGDGAAGAEVTVPVPAPAWSEGGPATAIAPQALIVHPTLADLAGGRLVLTPAGGWRSGDRLLVEAAGGVAVDGDAVRLDGAALGTLARTADGGLTVAFTTADATPAAAQAVLRAVRFSHDGDDPGSGERVIQVVVGDGAGASSVAVAARIPVLPIDDPPVVTGLRLAVPAEVPAVVCLVASDPDSSTLAWTLLAADPLLDARLLDGDRLLLAPRPGAAGTRTLRVRVADGTSAVEAAVAVLVCGPGGPRLHPAGDVPREAYAGSTLAFALDWETAAAGGDAVLAFSPGTDAPPGLALAADGPRRLVATWPVPADEPVRVHRRFSIIVQEQTGRGAGRLPLSLWILPAPRGDG